MTAAGRLDQWRKGIGEERSTCPPAFLQAVRRGASRRSFLGSGRWGVECLANLDAVPAKGATLVLGGPKVKGGTGGPSRVIVLV